MEEEQNTVIQLIDAQQHYEMHLWRRFLNIIDSTSKLENQKRKEFLQKIFNHTMLEISNALQGWTITNFEYQNNSWSAIIALNGLSVIRVSNETDPVCYFYEVLPGVDPNIELIFQSFTKEWWEQQSMGMAGINGPVLADIIWVDDAIQQFKINSNQDQQNTKSIDFIQPKKSGFSEELELMLNKIEQINGIQNQVIEKCLINMPDIK